MRCHAKQKEGTPRTRQREQSSPQGLKGTSATRTEKEGRSRLLGFVRRVWSRPVSVRFVFRPMLPPRCSRALFVPGWACLVFRVHGHPLLTFPYRFNTRPLLRARNKKESGSTQREKKWTEKRLERQPHGLQHFAVSRIRGKSRKNDPAPI